MFSGKQRRNARDEYERNGTLDKNRDGKVSLEDFAMREKQTKENILYHRKDTLSDISAVKMLQKQNVLVGSSKNRENGVGNVIEKRENMYLNAENRSPLARGVGGVMGAFAGFPRTTVMEIPEQQRKPNRNSMHGSRKRPEPTARVQPSIGGFAGINSGVGNFGHAILGISPKKPVAKVTRLPNKPTAAVPFNPSAGFSKILMGTTAPKRRKPNYFM